MPSDSSTPMNRRDHHCSPIAPRLLRARTPLVLAAVAVLAFFVLMAAFSSITLPLVSIGLNLLSVGAACGLVTLIFQDGNLQNLLGFTSYGAVSQWVPLYQTSADVVKSEIATFFTVFPAATIWSNEPEGNDLVLRNYLSV